MTSDIRVFEDVLALPDRVLGFSPHQFLFDKSKNQIDGIDCYFYRINDKKEPLVFNGSFPSNDYCYGVVDVGVFGGWMLHYFSHFMTDFLPRAWYQKNIKSEKTYFFDICPGGIFDWYDNYKSSLTINDFSKVFSFNPSNFEMIRKPTIFKKLIIPDVSLKIGMKPNDKWLDFVDGCNWFPTCNESYSKVYVSRLNFRGNMKSCFFGEQGFIDYLKSEGFYILDVNMKSVSDQWYIIKNADTVIIPEGGAVLWSLFCDRSNIITLSRRPKRICGDFADITDSDFCDISKNFTRSEVIDRILGVVDTVDDSNIKTANRWSNSSVIIDWKRVSLDLQQKGLVNNLYKESGRSIVDFERYIKVNSVSDSVMFNARKQLSKL